MTNIMQSVYPDSQKDGRNRWMGGSLLLLFLLLYLLPLGHRPMTIPDEVRYAEIPREMLVNGDWVSPRFNGIRYFEKPPLGYWMNASSIALLGENPFAVRLPSALAAGLTALLIFLFVLKLFSDKFMAFLATFIHMTFMEVYFVGTFNVLDNLLTLFLCAGMVSFFLATKTQDNRLSAYTYWVLSGLSLGLAFLTKGFLAFVIPVIVLVPWLIWNGYWRTLLLKSWLVILIAFLLVLPWGIIIHLRESDFWHYFFWIEHIKRFTAENAQHKAPLYYYIVLLPALAFPWFSLAPAAYAGLRSVDSDKEVMRFLWLWLLLPLLFFSLSSGKLATYLLPCFPPLAILIALGLKRYLQGNKLRLFKAGVIANLLILATLLLVLLVSQFFNAGFTLYQSDELPQFVLTLVAVIVGLAACLLVLKSSHPNVRIVMNFFSIIPFIILIQIATPNSLEESKAPGEFLNKAGELITSDTVVVADGSLFGAVNWYLKRADVYLINGGELSYGLKYPDAKGRLLDVDDFSSLLTSRRGRSVAIFCRKGCPEVIKDTFPDKIKQYSYGKFSLWLIS